MFWLLLAVAAGLIQGSFALPMKYTRPWKWEHTWSLWAVWALLIGPWATGAVTVPGLLGVLTEVPAGVLVVTFLVSAVWGVGAIAFGFGIDYLGMALGYAIIAALTTAFGSLIPLLIGRERVSGAAVAAIVAGVAVMMVGLAVGARAGLLKEQALRAAAGAGGASAGNERRKSVTAGLLFCVVAGVGGSLFNIAFVCGRPIQDAAAAVVNEPAFAPNAVWCVSLLGGFFTNVIYCLGLVHRNRDWALFRRPGTGLNWLRTAAMGLMWFGSLLLYGISSARLGPLGPSMGFAIFLGTAILTSNAWGILTGEWRGAGPRPLRLLLASVAVLLAGMVLIAWSRALAD